MKSSLMLAAATRVVVALIAIALIACGSPGPDPAADDSAGSLSLEHVATFGCDACGGIEQIQASYVSVSPSGKVLLVDRYEPFIRIFTLDGTPLAAFGVEGQGPDSVGSAAGQYFPPSGVFPGVDDAVLVYDAMPHRIKRFSPDGDFLGQSLLPQRVPTRFALDVERQRLWTVGYAPGDLNRLDRYDDLAGPTISPDLSLDDQTMWPQIVFPDRTSVDAHATIAARDGGFAIGDDEKYVIRVFDEEGRQVSELGRDIPRVPRSEADMERLWESYRRNPTVMGNPMPEPSPELPHFFRRTALASDDIGRLWVLTWRGHYRGTSVFDVFGPDGSFLQELEVEAAIGEAFNSYAIGAGHIAGIILDELDNTTIGVWRIVES